MPEFWDWHVIGRVYDNTGDWAAKAHHGGDSIRGRIIARADTELLARARCVVKALEAAT